MKIIHRVTLFLALTVVCSGSVVRQRRGLWNDGINESPVTPDPDVQSEAPEEIQPSASSRHIGSISSYYEEQYSSMSANESHREVSELSDEMYSAIFNTQFDRLSHDYEKQYVTDFVADTSTDRDDFFQQSSMINTNWFAEFSVSTSVHGCEEAGCVTILPSYISNEIDVPQSGFQDVLQTMTIDESDSSDRNDYYERFYLKRPEYLKNWFRSYEMFLSLTTKPPCLDDVSSSQSLFQSTIHTSVSFTPSIGTEDISTSYTPSLNTDSVSPSYSPSMYTVEASSSFSPSMYSNSISPSYSSSMYTDSISPSYSLSMHSDSISPSYSSSMYTDSISPSYSSSMYSDSISPSYSSSMYSDSISPSYSSSMYSDSISPSYSSSMYTDSISPSYSSSMYTDSISRSYSSSMYSDSISPSYSSSMYSDSISPSYSSSMHSVDVSTSYSSSMSTADLSPSYTRFTSTDVVTPSYVLTTSLSMTITPTSTSSTVTPSITTANPTGSGTTEQQSGGEEAEDNSNVAAIAGGVAAGVAVAALATGLIIMKIKAATAVPAAAVYTAPKVTGPASYNPPKAPSNSGTSGNSGLRGGHDGPPNTKSKVSPQNQQQNGDCNKGQRGKDGPSKTKSKIKTPRRVPSHVTPLESPPQPPAQMNGLWLESQMPALPSINGQFPPPNFPGVPAPSTYALPDVPGPAMY